ncbi:hypothetical protein ZEAMMB73_Zm00001d003267 [Zea mays]|uniref:Uncharacterized protein n=1 Tax=Zea mays TaxID=4577 RepID=A0A1D6E8A2_MAIZE|nr:hypothetical protein ZEAMMB73_Zm00001d003267 [Zea mays]ONM16616.1 hypothetical protein ZEAMMB73_Zm00001d003267 [Zea mays]ONM16628.1 hypothetical protein ZEAMMB73_Zm00001d003267 [Zea mays]
MVGGTWVVHGLSMVGVEELSPRITDQLTSWLMLLVRSVWNLTAIFLVCYECFATAVSVHDHSLPIMDQGFYNRVRHIKIFRFFNRIRHKKYITPYIFHLYVF